MTPVRWADTLARYCLIYYCLCGIVAFALDVVSGTYFSSVSQEVSRWLAPIGFVASAVAYVGYPASTKWRVAAIVLPILSGILTALLWIPVFFGS